MSLEGHFACPSRGPVSVKPTTRGTRKCRPDQVQVQVQVQVRTYLEPEPEPVRPESNLHNTSPLMLFAPFFFLLVVVVAEVEPGQQKYRVGREGGCFE